MRACARQASAEDPQNNGPLFQHTPESERGGERARSLEDYKRADFIKPEGRDEGVKGGMEGDKDMAQGRGGRGELEGRTWKGRVVGLSLKVR